MEGFVKEILGGRAQGSLRNVQRLHLAEPTVGMGRLGEGRDMDKGSKKDDIYTASSRLIGVRAHCKTEGKVSSHSAENIRC